MMIERKIKFRARDKTKKEMTQLPNPYISQILVATIFNHFYKNETNENNEYIFNEYIGIKDKNGNDIYVGDIIKSAGKYIILFGEHTINSIKNLGYYAENIVDKQIWGIGQITGMEIIGNIYENHELLTN